MADLIRFVNNPSVFLIAESSDTEDQRIESAIDELRPRTVDNYGLSVWEFSDQTEQTQVLTNFAICLRNRRNRIRAISFDETIVPTALEVHPEPASTSLSCVENLHRCIYLYNDSDVRLLAENVRGNAQPINRSAADVETLIEQTAGGCASLPSHDLSKIKPWINERQNLKSHFIRLQGHADDI